MTPLQEYEKEVFKARNTKENSIAKAEHLFLMKVKHAKNMLKIDQENCEHLDYNEKVVHNYHRRVKEITLICKNCGLEK